MKNWRPMRIANGNGKVRWVVSGEGGYLYPAAANYMRDPRAATYNEARRYRSLRAAARLNTAEREHHWVPKPL